MGRKRKYSSIIQFKKEIEYTENLISGLIITINSLKGISEIRSFTKLKNSLEDHKKYVKFDRERIESIYELGYIRLFASFECFMYEFLKELYIKFPNALPKDRKIEIEYILEWPTKNSIKDFIIDHISIQNSYDFPSWEKTLEKSFNIKVFEDDVESDGFFYFNLYRNMLAHSGGKINSKVAIDFAKKLGLTKSLPSKIKKNETTKIELKNDKFFEVLIKLFNKLIINIERKI